MLWGRMFCKTFPLHSPYLLCHHLLNYSSLCVPIYNKIPIYIHHLTQTFHPHFYPFPSLPSPNWYCTYIHADIPRNLPLKYIALTHSLQTNTRPGNYLIPLPTLLLEGNINLISLFHLSTSRSAAFLYQTKY